ncbi:MAG: hypothetical protein AAF570_13005, partial [Bacteroidota bacterium]
AAFNAAELAKSPFSVNDLAQPLSSKEAAPRRVLLPKNSKLLAVGDAILSFDPLAGQGIFFALYSGIKAAESILETRKGKASSISNAQYFEAVSKVENHQREFRKTFYLGEQRFPEAAYWKAQSQA